VDGPVTASVGWLVAAPLAGSVATFLLRGRRGASEAVLLLTALAAALATNGLVARIMGSGPYTVEIGSWGAPAGIEWAVDDLSAAFLAVALPVWIAATIVAHGLLHSPRSPRDARVFRKEPGPTARTFWPLWLLLWGGVNALFLSADLFNLYVALELAGLAGVALVATAGVLPALQAALRYFFANVAGSISFLTGVALVYHRYQTLDLQLLRSAAESDASTTVALALLGAGLLLKAALFPMHAWLPRAHAAAPAPVSAILSALVVKAPVYLVLRLWLDVFHVALPPSVLTFVGALGAIGIVWGSARALRVERLKSLIAYSTVAQVGLLFTAFPIVHAAGSRDARWGLVFLAVGHAVAKASMFLAAGGLARAHGHDRLDQMTGFGAREPLCTYAFGLGGMSLLGVPGTIGFSGKWLLATSGLEVWAVPWVVAVSASALLTAAYVWRVLAIAIRSAPEPAGTRPLARRIAWSAFALAVLTVALGLGSGPFVEPLP